MKQSLLVAALLAVALGHHEKTPVAAAARAAEPPQDPLPPPGSTSFPLARRAVHLDAQLELELQQAGATVRHRANVLSAYVTTPVVGLVPGTDWTLRRAEEGWIAQGPALPAHETEALLTRFGQAIRHEAHLAFPAGTAAFHVRTSESLAALVAALKRAAHASA